MFREAYTLGRDGYRASCWARLLEVLEQGADALRPKKDPVAVRERQGMRQKP